MSETKLPKYLDRYVASMRWPALLICKGKHDSDYYLLSDREALWRVSLRILKQRVDIGYIDKPGKAPSGLVPELSPPEIEALPSRYAIQERKIRERNEQLRKDYTVEAKEYDEAARALKVSDGPAAFLILKNREGFEYEGMTFQKIDVV